MAGPNPSVEGLGKGIVFIAESNKKKGPRGMGNYEEKDSFRLRGPLRGLASLPRRIEVGSQSPRRTKWEKSSPRKDVRMDSRPPLLEKKKGGQALGGKVRA